jgi:predicted dehydrogenase
LASDPNVDIVAVSVNVQSHYDNIKPALLAGKDVFVEWPLARNLAEAEELAALAKEKGVRTSVGLQARQSPTVIKAKELVAAGKLGKILDTKMHGYGSIAGPATTKEYQYTGNIENGANLITIPHGHAVDALCFVLGELESLSATTANHFPEVVLLGKDFKPEGKVPKTAHDFVAYTGTLVNGGVAEVSYAGGSSHHGKDFYWEINGTEGSLILENDKSAQKLPPGHIQMSQPTLKFVPKKSNPLGPPETAEVVNVEKAGEWDQGDYSFGVGKAWDAWAGVGSDKGYTITTFEDAVLRHRMIEAIYRSAENGTRESYL